MKLLIPILLNTVLVIAVYLLDKHTSWKKLPYMVKQVIIGVLFGGMAAFASGFGVEVLGTVINVRDAAPISAGLIFGAPAGIISGLIGGVYRWFSVLWGAGTYTRLACSLAAITSGFLAAGLRKLMFDNKKPTWGYGIAITVVCEVIHMLLIFLTNMQDTVTAFTFVKGCTLPMFCGNAGAVGLAIIAVSLLSHERLTRIKGSEHIAQTFQRWLLICIVMAYFVTNLFTLVLQQGMSQIETNAVITLSLEDVHKDITDASDKNLLEIAKKVKDEYKTNPDLDAIARKYGISEVNIIDENFIIVASSVAEYVGYDMASGEQSAEFEVLLSGETEFVQEYRQTSYDEGFLRKYCGVVLDEGGFIQVGYDSKQFHSDIGSNIVDATKNRHIGKNGFIAICDEKFNIVSDNEEYNGTSLAEIGISLDLQNMGEKTVYQCEVLGKPYLFGFTVAEGFCIIGAMPTDEAMFMRDASLYTSTFMQILIFATLFVFIYFLVKCVVINNLQKVNSSLEKITDGNLNVTVDVRSNAEFASLSDDINLTVKTLKQYITEAAARIDKELEYAKQIQLSVLPTNFPKNEDYGIFAQMIAAKEVGGDFYDFYKLNDTIVAFLVADVSGKGIPAAMFMMTAKTILKDLAESGMAVNDIFVKANGKLCENNESGMFVTVWMGMLDLATGNLKYANAGHNPPLVIHKNGEGEYLRTRAGFVLGGMEGVRYRINEMTLDPGDRIFLYTDGVTEATNAEEELYGEERLIAFMNQNRTVEAKKLLVALKADIDEFVGEAPQFDDITMLMLDYKKDDVGGNVCERVFPAEDTALRDVLGFVEETLESAGCPMKVTMALCVAIEEVFVNVAHYAYGDGKGDVKLAISLSENDSTVIFRMSDKGTPFDPLKRPDPDITLPVEEKEIGGLGIFITKKTMDTVSYAYKNGENILTMTKKFQRRKL